MHVDSRIGYPQLLFSHHQTIQVFFVSVGCPIFMGKNVVFARNHGSMKIVLTQRKRGNEEPSGFVQSTDYTLRLQLFCFVHELISY